MIETSVMPHVAVPAEETALLPEHRKAVRDSGVVDTGPFVLAIQGDFVRTEVRRSPDLPELIYQFRVLEEVRRVRGRLFVMSVIGPGVAAPPADHRRWTAEWDLRHGADALAVVSPGNTLFAVVISLVLRTRELFKHRPRPFAFFSTEEAARAWLGTLRTF